MKMLLSFLCLTLFSSLTNAESDYDIETFCQDLNVILYRVEVHTTNIANNQTTRTEDGIYYKRTIIDRCYKGECVLSTDHASPILRYLPSHPDANEDGYVSFPNFSVLEEMDMLIKAQKAYELVVKNMPEDLIDLLHSSKPDYCSKNYAFFKDQYDFSEFLKR